MKRPRRSPSGEQRRRDPERTRERILEAAMIEFGEHGYAGARTSAIAARAGVNQQLISYYFDGKEGLYRTLQRKWEATGGAPRPDLPLAELLGGFLRLNATQRSGARLLAWEGLTATEAAVGPAADTTAEPEGDPTAKPAGDDTTRPPGDRAAEPAADPETDAYYSAMVDDLRRRQQTGELSADLDPAYVQLMLFAATLAPTVLPQIARRLTGLPANSPEFLTAYTEQLRRVIALLAGPSTPPS